MKAIEIVEKLKSVLLSAEEPQEVIVAEEQIELAEEKVEEMEVNDPEAVEAPAEEPMDDDKYATKEELITAVAEMKAMYDAIVEKMGSEEMEVEVPTEELSKEELSSQEDGAAPITHSPEAVETAPQNFLNLNKPRNTQSIVYEKMFN